MKVRYVMVVLLAILSGLIGFAQIILEEFASPAIGWNTMMISVLLIIAAGQGERIS